MATGLASGRDAIKEYVKCTLLCRTLEKKVAYSIMESALRELVDENLLHRNYDESYEATQLGQAIVASAFSPEDGLFVHDELRRALEAFVMDGDMHVFYIFTPLQISASIQVDWHVFREQVDFLDDSGIRALQFIGVSPGFINTMYSPPLVTYVCYAGYAAANETGPKPGQPSKNPIPRKPTSPESTAARTQPSNSATSATKCHCQPYPPATGSRAAPCRPSRSNATASRPGSSSSATGWDGACLRLRWTICEIGWRRGRVRIYWIWRGWCL